MTDVIRPCVIITGASSGIGAEYARKYAREGYDLVLVARSARTLDALGAELSRAHGVGVEVLVADLSAPAGLAVVGAALAEGLPRIDHLVNCAGVAPDGDLARADGDELRRMVDLNITALTELTRVAVVRMRAQRHGTIVNIGSAAAYQPMPHMAAYAASKSYVQRFTEAISEENRAYGLRIFAVAPSATDTPMNPGAAKGKRTPAQVVATTWRALPRRTPSVVDGLSNAVLAQIASRVLPTRVSLRIAGRMMRDKA